MRYYALVFRPESVTQELNSLKCKMVDQWDEKSLMFLLNVYKGAKRDLEITNQITKDMRKLRVKEIRQRAMTP